MSAPSAHRLCALSACVLLAASACDDTLPEPSSRGARSGGIQGTVRVSGSSALQPLVSAAKEGFEVREAGVSVEVSAGGSKKGLADVASRAVHIGASDLFAPDDLSSQLVDHKVAVMGFAVMANRGPFNETITALRLEDVAKVFSGAITDWKELGGAPSPIVVINRGAGSGTRTVFGKRVLGNTKFVEAQTEDNSGALVAKLKHTKGAISYLALSFTDDALVTFALLTDSGVVTPSAENIQSGKYPIWSYEHLYTNGALAPATKSFLDYILSPEFQGTGLSKGFLPIASMKVSRAED